jgi:hypothetical protein
MVRIKDIIMWEVVLFLQIMNSHITRVTAAGFHSLIVQIILG